MREPCHRCGTLTGRVTRLNAAGVVDVDAPLRPTCNACGPAWVDVLTGRVFDPIGKPPEPIIDERGVPLCATEGCGRYDGKRCDLLGYRPSRVCEPAVQELVRELQGAKREIRRWQTGNQIEGDYVPPDLNTSCRECIVLVTRTPLGTPFSCDLCGAEYDVDHALVKQGRIDRARIKF